MNRHRGLKVKIGFLAPQWVPVPPAYGGTEEVIDVLARQMSARGHDVKLFATGDSTCSVPTEYLYPEAVKPINHWPSLWRHLRAGYEALGACDRPSRKGLCSNGFRGIAASQLR